MSRTSPAMTIDEPEPGSAELDDLTLSRARRGDRDALHVLVARYQDRVFAYVSRLLAAAPGDPRVEDIAQDTFLRVLGAISRFDPDGSARLSTWILTIATRRALDELRRSSKVVRAIGEGRVAEAPRSVVTRSVQRAVAELSADQRAAFLLHEMFGLSLPEIAAALEVELGTVKSRIGRARARLRQALEVDDET